MQCIEFESNCGGEIGILVPSIPAHWLDTFSLLQVVVEGEDERCLVYRVYLVTYATKLNDWRFCLMASSAAAHRYGPGQGFLAPLTASRSRSATHRMTLVRVASQGFVSTSWAAVAGNVTSSTTN